MSQNMQFFSDMDYHRFETLDRVDPKDMNKEMKKKNFLLVSDSVTFHFNNIRLLLHELSV